MTRIGWAQDYIPLPEITMKREEKQKSKKEKRMRNVYIIKRRWLLKINSFIWISITNSNN